MKKIYIVLFIILLFFGKYSYGGWLDTGKELLNKYTNDTSEKTTISELSNSDIVKGLKEALVIGTENVVKKLGKRGSFLNDAQIHIPLPDKIEKIKNVLSTVGMGNSLEELEVKLNRAAELATPKAKKIFWNAIKKMTLSDVKKIYKGPDNAATMYFKNKMTPELIQEMKPVIKNTLNEVEAIQLLNSILDKYNSLPFVRPLNLNLDNYVANKALDGIFYYLAKEEAAIRKNPLKRTTEILKKVFGAN